MRKSIFVGTLFLFALVSNAMAGYGQSNINAKIYKVHSVRVQEFVDALNGAISTQYFVTVSGKYATSSNITFSGQFEVQFTEKNTPARESCYSLLEKFDIVKDLEINIIADGFWSNAGSPYTPYILISGKNRAMQTLKCQLKKR